jgi:hypothetical protein
MQQLFEGVDWVLRPLESVTRRKCLFHSSADEAPATTLASLIDLKAGRVKHVELCDECAAALKLTKEVLELASSLEGLRDWHDEKLEKIKMWARVYLERAEDALTIKPPKEVAQKAFEFGQAMVEMEGEYDKADLVFGNVITKNRIY